jgi:hypothetical protein
MYQLATEAPDGDRTLLFIETCTGMTPTAENMRLVRSATSLVRRALRGADVKPLRDFVRRTRRWSSDVEDVLAAAGQAVVDEMESSSRTSLHDVVRQVAQIEREALASGARRDVEGNLRTAYAG